MERFILREGFLFFLFPIFSKKKLKEYKTKKNQRHFCLFGVRILGGRGFLFVLLFPLCLSLFPVFLSSGKDWGEKSGEKCGREVYAIAMIYFFLICHVLPEKIQYLGILHQKLLKDKINKKTFMMHT